MERQVLVMNKQLKNSLLDIAAELLVSPIALYAKAAQLKHKFDESETGQKTEKIIKQAGTDINAAAKSFADSETGRLIKKNAQKTGSTITETFQKIEKSETAHTIADAAKKVSESAAMHNVMETAKKAAESPIVAGVKDAASRVADNSIVKETRKTISDLYGMVRDAAAKENADHDMDCETETERKGVADIINDVDVSDIVGENEDEGGELAGDIDDEEDTPDPLLDAKIEKLGNEISDSVKEIFEED